jgi:hypothetical protein
VRDLSSHCPDLQMTNRSLKKLLKKVVDDHRDTSYNQPLILVVVAGPEVFPFPQRLYDVQCLAWPNGFASRESIRLTFATLVGVFEDKEWLYLSLGRDSMQRRVYAKHFAKSFRTRSRRNRTQRD